MSCHSDLNGGEELLVVGSIILAVGTVVFMVCISRQYRIGWLIGLATQAVAIPYDGITRQYGMLVLALVLSVIYAKSLANWSRPAASNEQLAKAAYYHWLDRGCPLGDDESDWQAAQAQLNGCHKGG